MRVQSCTFVYTDSYEFIRAIFAKMDEYENVTAEGDTGTGYPREYFTITLGEDYTYRIMLQSNGSSWFYVCPCGPNDSGGTYTARFQFTLNGIYTQENTPDGRNVTYMKFFTDDFGNFLGFSMPYYDSKTNPHFWLVTTNNAEGFPVLIDSYNSNAYKMVDTPTSVGQLVQTYNVFHESNETVYIEQVTYTSGDGGGLKDLWVVGNNSFYNSSQVMGAYMFVNTDRGQYLKLRNFIWAEISYVNSDEKIIVEAS